MPSLFAALAIEATASVDEIMAESWQLFPMMEAPDRSGADIVFREDATPFLCGVGI